MVGRFDLQFKTYPILIAHTDLDSPFQCYMAPHTGDDDPAVYRSGTSNKAPCQGTSGEEADDDEEEDDDGALLTVQAGFNRLLLVLRDEGVMRFVKYVSAAGPGSRWDVCAEYGIGLVVEAEKDEPEA